MAATFGCLPATFALGVVACGTSETGTVAPVDAAGHEPATDAAPASRQLLYAALQDGTVHVYDINAGHHEVKWIQAATGVSDVRGACANARPGAFYVSYKASDGGHVVAIDLRTDQVLWNETFLPSVDRLSCTPDGKKLYVPSNEAYTDDELIVVDAVTGAEQTRIHVTPRPHDSLNGLSGAHVYLETKSSNLIAQIDTSTDTIEKNIGPFSDIGGPFTINGAETRLYGNFFGVNGFQVGDISTGQALEVVTIPGQTSSPGALNQHGIALTPDEKEVWVPDGSVATVHVFDVTASPPLETHRVQTSYGALHWIAFSIDGRFAYPSASKNGAPDVDVVDTATYSRIGKVGPSEDMLEIDFAGTDIVRVGNQFAVGRVP